jgi:chromosome partitioning protein
MKVAICNHKGGVGKTITAYWLAQHWATQGYTPMAIDLDPQGNLTRMFGGTIHHANGVADVLLRRTALAVAVQMVGEGAAVQLVGTDIKLEDAGAAIQAKAPNHRFLANALRDAGDRPVLIDCAPAANILTVNALVAADYVLVVLDPEHDAIEGMRRIISMVDWLRCELGQAPQVLGAVVTKVQGATVLHRSNLLRIDEEMPILGVVPYRRGVDADEQLRALYWDVAIAVMQKLTGEEESC